jgi:hypothetical protein
MTINLKYMAALAGLALASGVNAQQISKPLSSLAPNSNPGTILCRGGNGSIPMTTDEEQSLPLHVVARLDCGQQVSLLSGNDGYTVNVRTADGKTGYVAWMNIAKGAAGPVQKPVAPSAEVVDGTANWAVGAPGSERFYTEGLLVESLTANGVTVQVSLQDTGWKILANVAVANNGLEGVNVVPAHITLADLTNSQLHKSLNYEDPKKLRGAVNHQILWSQHNAVPSDSGYLVSTNYQTSNPLMKTSTENYLADHQATVAMVSDRKAEFNPHSQMGAVALKESTVLPSQKVAGATWFQREGKREDMVLRVPVGGVVYEFPFSFSKEKEKGNQ